MNEEINSMEGNLTNKMGYYLRFKTCYLKTVVFEFG